MKSKIIEKALDLSPNKPPVPRAAGGSLPGSRGPRSLSELRRRKKVHLCCCNRKRDRKEQGMSECRPVSDSFRPGTLWDGEVSAAWGNFSRTGDEERPSAKGGEIGHGRRGQAPLHRPEDGRGPTTFTARLQQRPGCHVLLPVNKET